MADGTSVGKITLQIDLTQDLQAQITDASSKISAGLKGSLEKSLNIDGLLNNMSQKFKGVIDGINSSLDTLQSKVNSITNKPVSASGAPVKQTGAATAPKVTGATDIGAIKAQIDSLAASLEVTNRMIEQQQARLAILKQQYDITFDIGKKNQLEGQILRTEARINSLILSSDAAGIKLSDLDAQFAKLSSSANGAAGSIDNVNNKLTNTGAKATKSGAAFDRTVKQMGLSSSMLGRLLDRMLLRMFLFNTVIKAITAFNSYLGSALMTNQQFSNSLAQIKSNLAVAFMPIYNAVLPAINALMSWLARATTYIAAFISALFGTSYAASAASAKGLNSAIVAQKALEKQTKATTAAVKGQLAGFDEINVLGSKDKGANTDIPTSIANSVPKIVAPPVDVGPSTEAMKKIRDAADKVRAIFQALWPVIVGVVGAFLAFRLISGVANIIRGVGLAITALMGMNPIGWVAIIIGAIIALGIIIYNNWDAIKAFLIKTWNDLKVIATNVWNAIANFFTYLWNTVSNAVRTAWNSTGQFLTNLWNNIRNTAINVWNSIATAIRSAFTGIGNWFGNVFTDAWNRIRNAFSSVTGFFQGIWNTIRNMFNNIGTSIGNGIANAFAYVVNSIIGFAERTINGFIRAINKAINLINAIPGVNIRPLNTLNIPRLATGGIIDQPTLAMVGEAGPERITPLSKDSEWLDSLASRMNNGGDNNDEIIRLLKAIIEILKNLGLSIQIDGTTFGKVSATSINKASRAAGKPLIVT